MSACSGKSRRLVTLCNCHPGTRSTGLGAPREAPDLGCEPHPAASPYNGPGKAGCTSRTATYREANCAAERGVSCRKPGVSAVEGEWPGTGSNRRPSAFQAERSTRSEGCFCRACAPRETSSAPDLGRKLGGVAVLGESVEGFRDLSVAAAPRRSPPRQRVRRSLCPAARWRRRDLRPHVSASRPAACQPAAFRHSE